MSCPCKKKKKHDIKFFKAELRSRDLDDDIIDILIDEGFSRLSHVRGLEVEDLKEFRNLSRAQFVVLRTKIREKWDKIYENEDHSESSSDSEGSVGLESKNIHTTRQKAKDKRRHPDHHGHTKCHHVDVPHQSTEESSNQKEANEPLREIEKKEFQSRFKNANESKKPNSQEYARRPKAVRESKSDELSTSKQETVVEELEKEEFQLGFKEDTNETKKSKSQESPSIPTFPREFDGNSDGNTSDHETVVEDAVQSDGLWEHFNCALAKKFFKKRNYEAMERVLVNVDMKTKSAMGRGRFATMISKGCNDFAELHDCINHHMTDIDVMHDLICQQLISLAESHRDVLQEMKVEPQCNTFGEWAKLSDAVFGHKSTLKYGSFEWQKVISKTKELAQFFSSLPNAARNVSKSYILLILQFTCRVWLTRNHILPGEHQGLLRIATFCLPLCESDLVKSKYYCKSKHDVYVHAAITLGCTISNKMLDVETWYDEFCTFKSKSEQYYDEGFQIQIDLRSEDDTRNLTKFTRIVETRWAAYISTYDFREETEPEPRDTVEHHKLLERHVNEIMKHWSSKSYSEFRQSIIDAEDALLETDFKLQIGGLLSPTFHQICNALKGSFKQITNPRALFECLHSNLMDLVVDCKRLLKELKVYSNDSLADWVEVFFGFCSSGECIYGSVRWMEALDRSKNAVDDTTRGVDPTGRAIMQLYVQLIIELVVEAFVAYENLNPNDRIGHVRLASMNMTMVKSPLLTNKWYSKMRYNVYICGVRSLAACIVKEDSQAKETFYEQYISVKEILDLLIVESRKSNVPLASKEDKHKLSALYKDVEKKMFGVPDGGSVPTSDRERRKKAIASDPNVANLVRLAVNAYEQKKFDQMTKHLDSAEKKEGSCDVRLAFAGNVSTNFDLVVTFSNNIPEPRGSYVVKETTKKNLRYLANDHQQVMEHIGETKSSIMEELIVGLFEQNDAKPGTGDWKLLKNKAIEMVTYFEGLTENGHSVTKAYILLFLTVLHNFIATRNRLCRGEHDKLLPFIMPCVIICESPLLESDAWIKTKFDVYEIAVLETGSALGTGQIPCAPFFPKYSRVLQELTEMAAKCNIYVCDDNQQRQIDKVRKAGFEFYRGSEDRMCIMAAILYYKSGCYTGLMAILNAADQTSSAVNIRMNFNMRVSSTFEKCVDYHNSIADESTYIELVSNSYLYLCKASEDFSDFVKKMGETESNDLRSWVDELFQATNGKPSLNPVLELKSVTEKGKIAAQYILRMSEEARCIAQIYLHFFMSFIVNFITKRRALHTKDIYNGGLKITLAVIILCKDVLVTSNFSIREKQQLYSVAATYMTEVNDESDIWMSEMETVVNELGRLKELRKEFEEQLKRRASLRKEWPGYYEDTEYECKEKKQQATNTRGNAEQGNRGIEKLNKDFSPQLPAVEVAMRMKYLRMDQGYEHGDILSWDAFSDICMSLDSCNDANLDWRALAEKWGLKAKTIEIWHEKNTENPTKTMLFSFFSKNVELGLSKLEILEELHQTLTDLNLHRVAKLVFAEMKT